MPTYDYRCEKCENVFEEFLPMAKRAEPTEKPCSELDCDGKVNQHLSGATAFAYDKIASKGHPKKPPGWMTDKLKEIKKNQPKATMSWHH